MKIFDKVVIWASWSERPIMKGCTGNSCLEVLVKILSIKVQQWLKVLVGNFTALKRLQAANRESKSCLLESSSRWFILKPPHKIMSVDVL
jgi:hypothetical protein